MSTEEKIQLARRALAHLQAKTTDQAPGNLRLPVSLYTDPARYQREREAIFLRRPLGLALSLELPGPDTYLALTVMERPVLISRGSDGVARAFINACRHRGAPVCKDGHGPAARFVCPYHAWQYDTAGRLKGVYGASTFGEAGPDTHSLTALPCEERAGIVWVCLTPGESFDLEPWLDGMAAELEALQLRDWHLYEQRWIEGPGWKVAWDGYLEAYHHNTVHAQTVGRYTIGNLMLHDTYGPHQRLVFGRRTLGELLERPESGWDPDTHLRQIHSVFPNLSISGVLGDHCLISQVFPGPGPDSSLTRQLVLVASRPEGAEAEARAAAFSATVLQAVRDEDYAIGMGVQRGLLSGGNEAFTIGRNEPAIQHYHRWVARLSGESLPC